MIPKKNSKQKKELFGSVFFLLISIFVFASIAIGSFFRVTTFLYDKEIAIANKIEGEEILSILPMTGTPDDQFFLMALTIIFAIAITFAIMLKLSRMKFNVKDESGKGKKLSIKSNPALFILFSILIITLIVGVALVIKQSLEVSTIQLTSTEFTDLSLVELKETKRTPGTKESFYITANPKTEFDTVAMIRLQFSNVKILNVEPNYYLTMGTCENGKIFTEDQICADVSNKDKFKFGDKLLKVTVEWGNTGEYEIKSIADNGYYNGKEVCKDDILVAFDALSFLPLTGDEETAMEKSYSESLTSQESIAAFILVGAAFIGVLIFLILLVRTHPVFKKVAVFYSIGLIIVLGGSAVYISNQLQKEQTALDAEAASWFKCDNYNKICADFDKYSFYKETGAVIEKPGKFKTCVNDNTRVCIEGTEVCTEDNDIDQFDFTTEMGFLCEYFLGAYQAKCKNCPSCQEENAYGPFRYLSCNLITTPSVTVTEDPVYEGGWENCSDGNYWDFCKWNEKNTSGKDRIDKKICTNNPLFISNLNNYNNQAAENKKIAYNPNMAFFCDRLAYIFGDTPRCKMDCYNCKDDDSGAFSGTVSCNASPTNTTPIVTPDTPEGYKRCEDRDAVACQNKDDYYTVCEVDGDKQNEILCIDNLAYCKKCANNCSYKTSKCIEDQTEPTGTNPPTTPTGTNPTNYPQPTSTTSPGAMQCGQKGCTKDSDCEIGTPDYECDEKADPSQNVCIRLCKANETRVDQCTCSSDSDTVACGKIDTNGDGILNYIDLAQFAKVYNKHCLDSAVDFGVCGGKDNNKDGVINYIDLGHFALKYYPRSATCNL